MHHYKQLWLNATRMVAKAFIEKNYLKEAPLFDAFWDAFSSRMHDILDRTSEGWPEQNIAKNIVTEISFAKENALDLVTPIVLATTAEVIREVNAGNTSLSELENFIGRTAARFGARVELTASLVRSLPSLCKEVLSTKPGMDEAIVSAASVIQYLIWTKGDSKVVKSIREYEKHKADYLFWIDLNEKSHMSEAAPNRRIAPEAVALLKYLVENIGTPIPVTDVLRDVFHYDTTGITDIEKNRIEQQITKLHLFCGGQFREHLFGERFTKGLGLKTSFADKYFLFSRLR